MVIKMKKLIISMTMLLLGSTFMFDQNENVSHLRKVLVIYYSYSTNANTEKIAKIIQGLTGADMYKIDLVEPFPDMPDEAFTQWIREEQTKKNYPAIKTPNVDISDYDCIFVGGPVWWHTTPLPLTSFLLETDFKGKPVAPFATSESNPREFLEDFAKIAKNARILNGKVFGYVWRDEQIEAKVTRWVKDLQL
jgi:flavodoxin